MGQQKSLEKENSVHTQEKTGKREEKRTTHKNQKTTTKSTTTTNITSYFFFFLPLFHSFTHTIHDTHFSNFFFFPPSSTLPSHFHAFSQTKKTKQNRAQSNLTSHRQISLFNLKNSKEITN